MKKTTKRKKNKKNLSIIGLLCWLIVPSVSVILLVLDGVGIYNFNTQRLIVIGACVLVLMIPFFEEITIKSISLKKENNYKK